MVHVTDGDRRSICAPGNGEECDLVAEKTGKPVNDGVQALVGVSVGAVPEGTSLPWLLALMPAHAHDVLPPVPRWQHICHQYRYAVIRYLTSASRYW